MPLIVSASDFAPMSFNTASAINDLTPEQQMALICAEMAKPVKPETVRAKLFQYWRIIGPWAEQRPALFDAVMYQFVAELEQRHASAPDGIRHLREIAKS